MSLSQRRCRADFTAGQQLYQQFSTDEAKKRNDVHYEHPVEFFYPILGGKWQVYSCYLWDKAQATTESQEEKLDLMAQLMGLKPGQRVLDVGCGWGGPLAYLCETYGVRGVGLTLSATQKRAAEQRIADHGVDARVVEGHWRDFTDEQGFDAIYSDEAIVHFSDLGHFFSLCHGWLHEGGRMVHKELHYTHPRHKEMTRGLAFLNEFFGNTCSYRTLAEELHLANEAGFEVQNVHQIPLAHYHKTLDVWLANMRERKAELEQVVGAEHYHRFRRYLKLVHAVFSGQTMTLDIVVSHKLSSTK